MKPVKTEVVAAPAGYFVVYDFGEDKEINIGEQIIAWRIETYERNNGGELFSSCIPLTVDGEITSNCIGVRNPDGTITVFEENTYSSLVELQKSRYPD